jgi:hypothetical protein
MSRPTRKAVPSLYIITDSLPPPACKQAIWNRTQLGELSLSRFKKKKPHTRIESQKSHGRFFFLAGLRPALERLILLPSGGWVAVRYGIISGGIKFKDVHGKCGSRERQSAVVGGWERNRPRSVFICSFWTVGDLTCWTARGTVLVTLTLVACLICPAEMTVFF